VKAKSKPQQRTGMGAFILDLVWIVAIVLGVQSFLVQPFSIPSGSMLPGLLVGDRVVALKFSYGYSRYSFPFSPNLFAGRIPERSIGRGDVAVFRLPSDPKVDFIKRVIGLPGDRIAVRAGRLYINGQMVERKPAGQAADTEAPAPRMVQVYQETLPNGVSYRIFEQADTGRPGDDTPDYVVPAGHYFMMGDNRDNSCDSRFNDAYNPGGGCPTPMGYVPVANFVGRASFVLFSSDGSAEWWEVWKWPFAIRYGRFFAGID